MHILRLIFIYLDGPVEANKQNLFFAFTKFSFSLYFGFGIDKTRKCFQEKRVAVSLFSKLDYALTYYTKLLHFLKLAEMKIFICIKFIHAQCIS